MAQNKGVNIAPKKVEPNAINKALQNPNGQVSFASYKNEIATILDQLSQKHNKRAISPSHMGHSINIFSVILPEQTCLSANQDLNLIAFTYRQDPSYDGGSGVLRTSFSTDGGSSFDSTTLIPWSLPISTGNYLARYPSGVIYNPNNNSDYENAAIIVAGPMLIGGSWGGDFYGSEFFNGTGTNNQILPYDDNIYPTTSNPSLFNRLFMQSRGNKFFVLGDAHTDDGTYYTSFKTVVNIGEWDTSGDSVIWKRVNVVPDFAITDGLPKGYSTAALAMADDGTNGYLVYSGRNPDAYDPLSYQPIIYETSDGGNTWDKITFNWGGISTIEDHADYYSRVGRPFFGYPLEAMIDKNGHLHFACYIHGAWSDHPDSLSYYANRYYMKGIVFDIFQTSSGWDAAVLDTVWCDDFLFYEEGGSKYYIDDRFQMSRTPDGKYIVFAWADSDTTWVTTTDNEFDNMLPNIFIKVYDADNNTYSQTHNVTRNTYVEDQATWFYLADQCFDLGNGNIKVPLSVGFLGGNYTSDDRIDYYFLNDIIIGPAGINNYTNSANIYIYPNPVSDQLNINLIDKGANFIKILNILGAEVYSTVIEGKDHCTIDLSDLSAGIYIISISNSINTAKKFIKK